MEKELIQLRVIGITGSRIKEGIYGLILGEVSGESKFPIAISEADAQAIAIQLEQLTSPLPIVHDLIIAIGASFDIHLTKIVITQLSEGNLASALHFQSQNTQVEITSRTPDAIALALRNNTPIYIQKKLFEQIAMVGTITNTSANNRKMLEKKLEEAVKREEYEVAAKIQATLKEIDNQESFI